MTATITVRAILSNVFYKLCGKMHLHVISGSLQDSECCVNGFLVISNFFSLDEIETCNQGVFSQQFVRYDPFHGNAHFLLLCKTKQQDHESNDFSGRWACKTFFAPQILGFYHLFLRSKKNMHFHSKMACDLLLITSYLVTIVADHH